MTISEVKRQTRLTEWRAKILAQQSSGLSVKEWCEQQCCGEGKYYYWLKQVRAELLERVDTSHSSTPALSLIRVEAERLPVTAPAAEAAIANPQNGIIVRYGTVAVELPAGTTSKALAELLKALNTP